MKEKIIAWVVFFALLLLCSVKSNSQCLSSGSKNGGLFTNSTGVGSLSWVNPNNVITSNSIPSVSGAVLDTGDIISTNYLYAQNFGFNIPSNAIVCGISVKFERKQQGANGSTTIVKDNAVYLLKSNAITGTNHAYSWNWPNTYSNIVHGGMSDTWGTTWTPAEINSPNFGAAISVRLQSTCCDLFLSADIDHISMTVFYTIPLPVTWLSFNASATNPNHVQLDWSTASENNSDYYVIQRSSDANNWEEVDRVVAVGNSNVITNYQATDNHPYIGKSYYRLQQFDFNGEYNFSEIITLNNQPENGIYINYESVSSSFVVQAMEGQNGHVIVTDQAGRLIRSAEFHQSNLCSVNMENVIEGIYFVIVETAEHKEVKKFLIQ